MLTRSPGPVKPEQEPSFPTRLCPPEFTVPSQSGPVPARFPAMIVFVVARTPVTWTPPPLLAPGAPQLVPHPALPPHVWLRAIVAFRRVSLPASAPPLPSPPLPPTA